MEWAILQVGAWAVIDMKAFLAKSPPVYNLCAVFAASTSHVVEILLQSGFDDLEVVGSRERKKMPLLHFCIARRILNRRILQLLRRQATIRWVNFTPLQYGMSLIHSLRAVLRMCVLW